MSTLSNVNTSGGEANPPCIGLIPGALPEAKSSKTGVSVNYVPDFNKKWYVFRASYGRVYRASDYLIEDGTYTYIAQRYVNKNVNGKMKKLLEPLIPNLLFAYVSDQKAEVYVKATPALSFLSFYYNHFELDGNQKNPPLIIPQKEMDNFIQATISKNEHLMFVQPAQCHFKSGQPVRVIDGPFMGVVGKIARVAGQQRVVIDLSQVGLISTAYIPSAFIEKIET